MGDEPKYEGSMLSGCMDHSEGGSSSVVEGVALKPCPFCGAEDVYTDSMYEGEERVFCAFCDTQGPCKRIRDDAIAAWNTRAITSHNTAMGEVTEAAELRRWRDDRRKALDNLIVAAATFWGTGSEQHNLVRDVSDAMFRDSDTAMERARLTALQGVGE